MGDAEEVYRREQELHEKERREKQDQEEVRKREVIGSISELIPQAVDKLRRHGYTDAPSYGLKRQGMEVDGVERPVWWVAARAFKTLQPTEHFYMTGDGTFVSHYGHSMTLDGKMLVELEIIHDGLQRLIETQPVPASPAEPPSSSQQRKGWRRFLG